MIFGRSKSQLHKAFAKHLKLVGQAVHDIEQVFSCDYGEGDEVEAIERVVSKQGVLQSTLEEAIDIRNQLDLAIKEAEE